MHTFQTKTRHPDDQPIDRGDAGIAVFGMGPVGIAAYDDMRECHGDIVLGVDQDPDVVKLPQEAGRKVILGDPMDIDFCDRVRMNRKGQIRIVLLTLPNHSVNMQAVKELTNFNFKGVIAATAQFDDQVEELKAAGLRAAYNLYSQAGYGFAEHASQALDNNGFIGSQTGQAHK